MCGGSMWRWATVWLHCFVLQVLLAIQQHEQRSGRPFDLVACWRHDLFFGAPLHWATLPRAQLWFLAQCCASDAIGLSDFAFAKPAHETLAAECGADGNAFADDHFSDLCRAGPYLAMVGSGKNLEPDAQYNYWVNDWLFVAPSPTAHSFGLLHANLALYRHAVKLVGINMPWSHFYWTAHVHHVLHTAAGVRALPLRANYDAWLGRISRGCRTNATVRLPMHPEPIWDGMQQALCPETEYGRVVCANESPRCQAEQLYAEPLRVHSSSGTTAASS